MVSILENFLLKEKNKVKALFFTLQERFIKVTLPTT